MKQDEIIEMARQADVWTEKDFMFADVLNPKIETFAKLVEDKVRQEIIEKNAPVIKKVNEHIKELQDAVKAEREACAAICDEETNQQSIGGNSWWATTNCAEAIRARGNT